jgi:hypothetical protein
VGSGDDDDDMTKSKQEKEEFDLVNPKMAMVTRKPLVKFKNDATACFDRILVHLLNLCLRSYGMPKKLAKHYLVLRVINYLYAQFTITII